jgi:hypothetical protein
MGANGSGLMTNMTEPHNGRYPFITPFIKLHNCDTYEGEFLTGGNHGHGIYTWSDGTRYEGEYLDSKNRGRDIETLSDRSRHEVEYCNVVKSAKKTPCVVYLVVGFVVLSLIVYFGISLFYFF